MVALERFGIGGMMAFRAIRIVLGSLLLTVSSAAFANWQINLAPGVTPMSRQMYHLHMVAIWVCVGIGIVVFGVMIYSLIMHRKSRGVEAAIMTNGTIFFIN